MQLTPKSECTSSAGLKAPRWQAGQYIKKAKVAAAGDRVHMGKKLGQFFSTSAAATDF
jgi:hypothetical protein